MPGAVSPDPDRRRRGLLRPQGRDLTRNDLIAIAIMAIVIMSCTWGCVAATR